MESKRNKNNYGKCRCCLTKGYHKDIMKEYYHNGKREVYFDVFMECFNMFLSTNEELSSLICKSCVTKLREASSFKMMAESSEKLLLDELTNRDDKNTVFVNVPVEDSIRDDLMIKAEELLQVKDEPPDCDDADVDYDSDFAVESDTTMKESETEITVAGETELLARFDRSELTMLPTRSALRDLCPNYVRHLNVLRGIEVFPRMIKKLMQENNKSYNSKKVYVTEKVAQIINSTTLLENSNMTPFRSKSRNGYPCFFCRHVFQSYETLTNHTYTKHSKSDIVRVLKTYGSESFLVNVEVTNLKCTLCDQNIRDLKELKSHLSNTHKKKIYTEFSDKIIPYKLSGENFECQFCGCNFETFGAIERHMNVHFRNYVCKECGGGFVTKYRLKVHLKAHNAGTFPCEICGKIFTSPQKHKNHVDTVHRLIKRFKCTQCPERFTEYFRRQKHMVDFHGMAPLQYKCNVCDKIFERRYTLSRHMKRDHLEERDFQCELCSYKCFSNNELNMHMIKHNGERIYECSVCKKSYARKKTLSEHMRIHNNDRRFACKLCGQAFVQKCSLKGHMKTHHLEYVA